VNLVQQVERLPPFSNGNHPTGRVPIIAKEAVGAVVVRASRAMTRGRRKWTEESATVRFERKDERLRRRAVRHLMACVAWIEFGHGHVELPPRLVPTFERLRRDVNALEKAQEALFLLRRRRRRHHELTVRPEAWGPGNARLAGSAPERRDEEFESKRLRRQLQLRATRCVELIDEFKVGDVDLTPTRAAEFRRLREDIRATVNAHDLFMKGSS